ncbi:hypothetical protein BE11_48770 [Sorangium cellulosum]|nr:hypothetical protein BE11_48770 [Sorangium cellulosum]
MSVTGFVALAAEAIEVVGVAVIVVSLPAALVVAYRRRPPGAGWYQPYRRTLGRGILLGLELLVAADIIRTVSHVPTLEGVLILAGIVLIRTFLSFALEVELEGRWPWQRSGQEQT